MTKRYFSEKEQGSFLPFAESLKKDDLIILGLLLFLMGDGCEDKELLYLLGLLFFADKIPFLKGDKKSLFGSLL